MSTIIIFIIIIIIIIIIVIIIIIIIIIIIVIIIINNIFLLLSCVLSSVLFVNVCINVSYPFVFFLMSQVKVQQSHSLHLIWAYFIFVTTVFILIVFKFYDFVFLL